MKLRYKISIWLALALAGSLLWGGSVWLWLVGLQNYLLSGYLLLRKTLSFNGKETVCNLFASFLPSKYLCRR